jgi:hypothetical protein
MFLHTFFKGKTINTSQIYAYLCRKAESNAKQDERSAYKIFEI